MLVFIPQAVVNIRFELKSFRKCFTRYNWYSHGDYFLYNFSVFVSAYVGVEAYLQTCFNCWPIFDDNVKERERYVSPERI